LALLTLVLKTIVEWKVEQAERLDELQSPVLATEK